MSIELINNLLYFLTIIGQVFILLSIIFLLIPKYRKHKIAIFIGTKALFLSFLVALTSTLGSLYYSEIAGFTPCDLCWFQRIFMYPQVLLLGLACLKKDKNIINYGLAMTTVGWLISLYHNYIYYMARPTSFCSIITPCTQKYVIGFGYISIPFMAIIAFTMIGILLFIKKTSHES